MVSQPTDHHLNNPRRENLQDYTFSPSQELMLQILPFSDNDDDDDDTFSLSSIPKVNV